MPAAQGLTLTLLPCRVSLTLTLTLPLPLPLTRYRPPKDVHSAGAEASATLRYFASDGSLTSLPGTLSIVLPLPYPYPYP